MKSDNGKSVVLVYGGMILVMTVFFFSVRDFSIFGNTGTTIETLEANKEVIKDSVVKTQAVITGGKTTISKNGNTATTTVSGGTAVTTIDGKEVTVKNGSVTTTGGATTVTKDGNKTITTTTGGTTAITTQDGKTTEVKGGTTTTVITGGTTTTTGGVTTNVGGIATTTTTGGTTTGSTTVMTPVIVTTPVTGGTTSGGTTITGLKIADYYKGESTYNAAIAAAQAALTKQGGGNLIFTAGDYKVKPTIYIPSNVSWIGQGTARIYSAETTPYNILISTESGANNITIDNIVFDQRDDVAMTPNIATWSGEFLLYSTSANNVTIKNSTFYTYGVCAILSQSYYATPTTNITILNNKAYFKRRTNTFYDVSVFNIDGRNVKVEGNYIEGQDVSSYDHWKPRTAYEIHTPNGQINSNTSKNTEIGVLHVNWPTMWNTYESNYNGTISIKNNVISNAIIGVDAWSASTLPNTVTRNLTIANNNITLNLDTKYVPARGIALTDGDVSNSKFDNVTINDNQIKVTVSSSIPDVNTRMNLLQPGESVGAMYMNVKSTISNMSIYNNTVTNFPYSFLNLYRRNNAGENNVHDNVKVYNNTINTAAYVTTYKNVFESLYIVGYANNVSIYANSFTASKTPIGMLNRIEPLTNFNYSQN